MARCFNCMKTYSDGETVCPHCGYIPEATENDQYYLPRGTILYSNRYFIGVPINMGGFGIVYKAWDQTFHKLVAIKEYFPGGVAARVPGESGVFVYSKKRQEEFDKGKLRFLEEARRVAKFNQHPNIVDVFDFFEDNHTAYMVMEYMDGVTYKQYVALQGGRVDQQLALTITLDLLKALASVHAENILHRDINPSNVFICNNGVIKLFDFGAARMKETEMSMILTPGYAPPEQYSGEQNQGPFTDIYAVGATTYYALTGNKPQESTDRVTEDTLPSPRELWPEISPVISSAVMKAMELNPDRRFQSAEEFQRALLSKKPVEDSRKAMRRRRMTQRLLAAGIFLAILAVGTSLARAFRSQMTAVSLEPAELEVWLSADENDSEESVRIRFEAMSQTFLQDYPQITLDIKVYPTEEYEQRINEAAAENTLPDLFESDLLDPSYESLLISLDETLDLLDDPSAYYFLDQYDSLFESHLQMPLCFQLPLVYVRQSAEQIDDGTFAVNGMDYLIYEDLLGADLLLTSVQELKQAGFHPLTEAADPFLNGNVYRYYSDTSDYQLINESLPGQYQIDLSETDSLPARFDHLFSVGTDGNNGMGAQWLLYYLLSGNAQEILCVQDAEGLPLNRSECNTFFDVYGGELSQLQERITDSIGGDSWLKENWNIRYQYKGDEE